SLSASTCTIFGGGNPVDQDVSIQMDGQELRMAKRVWRIQRERVKHSHRCALHPKPGAASSQDEFRAGIYCVSGATRRGIRSQICFWMKWPRLQRSMVWFCLPTAPLRFAVG